MRTSTTVLATVLALAGQATAQSYNAFVGCLAYGSYDPNLASTLSTIQLPSRDPAGCAAGCSAQADAASFGYSAWDAIGITCQCVRYGRAGQPDFTAGSAWMASLDSSNACDPDDIDIRRLNSAWQESSPTCYSRVTPGGQSTRNLPAASLSECFSRCVTYPLMSFRPNPAGTFLCQCYTSVSGEVATTCAPDIIFQYGRSAIAAASGVYRRSLREAAKREKAPKQAKFPYCPDHSKACKITGSADGYECIETKYELESCGGCVEGEFGATGNSTISGTDCTQVSGVPMGAISCLDGKCIAYACEAGWKLRKGVCTKV